MKRTLDEESQGLLNIIKQFQWVQRKTAGGHTEEWSAGSRARKYMAVRAWGWNRCQGEEK